METVIQSNDRSRGAVEKASGGSSDKKTSLLFALVGTIYSAGVYIFKLKEDVGAVVEYYHGGDIYYSIVSVTILVLPSVFSAVYFGFKEVIRTQNQHCCVNIGKFIMETLFGLSLLLRQVIQYVIKLSYIGVKLCSGHTTATPEEAKKLEKLELKDDLLEFFQDFYAGFLAIFLQLYILYLEAGSQQEKSFFLPKQLIASLLSISKLLIAVKRKDDGPCTRILSFIGWMPMFAGRLLIFTLALTMIHIWLIPLLAVHVLLITRWVYLIATEKWKKSNIAFNRLPLAIVTFIVFGLPSLLLWPMMFQLNRKKRPLIYLTVVFLENFAMLGVWFLWMTPSKSYQSLPTVDYYYSALGGILTLAGLAFLLVYYCFKPKNTEKVVLHDIRANKNSGSTSCSQADAGDEKEQYGLYYEFCQVIFPLEITKCHDEDLLNLRKNLAGQSEPE